MQKVINRLRNSIRFKRFTYCCLVFFLFAYCFSIPSFGSRDRWNYIVYLLMTMLGIFVIVYSFLYKKPKMNKWLLLVPFFVIFSLFGTILYSHMYRSFLTLVLLAISFFVLYYCLCIIDNKRVILLLLSSGLFLFSLFFIFIYRDQLLNLNNFISGNLRLGSYFDNPNGVAAFAIIGYIMSFYSLLFIHKKYRWIFIAPIISMFVVGIATGSRTFVVSFITITLVITFFKFKKHLFIYFIVVGLFILVLCVLFNLPFMATIRDRFIRIIWTFFTDSSRVDTSTISRAEWLNYGFFLGNKNLLTGLGIYGFSVFSGVGAYTHSNFSEVWCDFGFPGFILFYSSMVICVVKSFRGNNKNKSLVLSIFIYYILVSFSNVFYYTKFYYFNIAFMYYLAFGVDSKLSHDASNVKLNKIVFTCDGMESGGAERVISVLSNELAKRGYDVTIIGVSTHNNSSFYKLNDNVKYITLHDGNLKRINSFKRVMLLRRQFKTIKPDIIISFLPHVIVYTYYASIGLKIPVIVSERSNPKTDPEDHLLRRLRKSAFNVADGVVFQTTEAKWCYKKSVRDKSAIIYNPVNDSIYNIIPSSKRNNVVLSVGRLTSEKNFKCLIDAFSIFNTKYPNYVLKIYGDGPSKNELKQYIFDKNVGNKVFLMGNNNEWQEIEKDDAMFIMSSNYEGMPNALIEAIGIGIPSISTDCPIGGPKEIIEDGVNGYLSKVNDPTDIANKMEMIVRSNALSYNPKEFLMKFETKKICSMWVAYIDDVIKEYFRD